MRGLLAFGAVVALGLILDDDEESPAPSDTTEGGFLVWPTPGCHRITSLWGVRGNPFDLSKPRECHSGLDIGCPTGTPVVAVDDGVVIRSDFKGRIEGGFVAIRHPDGYRSYYMHLSALHVDVGEGIRAGQQIGEVGSTGRSTGPHLHLQFMDPDGRSIDPAPFYGLQPGTPCR